ncbi:MAG: hypothetical protein KGI08_07515 [Thaumarchaeota archaeon]|nr:hypothetical protein [Nitrososphaerota archaeon]
MMNKLKALIIGLLLLTPFPATAQSLGTFTPQIVPALSTIVKVTGTNTASLTAVAYPRLLTYAHTTYTASATVGNRYISLAIIAPDGTTDVGDWHASAAITAGQTGYEVEFLPGTYRETAFDANHTIQAPFPMGLVIPANYTVKVVDLANVSATDNQTVFFETAPAR